MSTSAELFYGYVREGKFIDAYHTDSTGPWGMANTKKAHECTVGRYGYPEDFSFFLAVEESLCSVEEGYVADLNPSHFTIKAQWVEQLQKAATNFKIELGNQQPGWHLCLYI